MPKHILETERLYLRELTAVDSSIKHYRGVDMPRRRYIAVR